MRLPLGIPIIVKNVKITGPKGFVNVDLITDTGATITVLSWSVLKIIGYDPAIVIDHQEVTTANGVIEVPKLQVKSISIGNVEAKKVDIICHDIPELVVARGLLGLSFLKYFRTVIDYKESYLEIT